MFFDDRLATVLRQSGDGEAARRTQFRQLLDILGNRKFGPDNARSNSLVAAAWLRMDALAHTIPAQERAAMIQEPSWRFRSADLAAHLADFEPEVASAALARAELSAEDWSALIPRLPIRARGFLRLRRDLPLETQKLLEQLGVYDRGLPSPTNQMTPAQELAAETARAVPLQAHEGSEGLVEYEPSSLGAAVASNRNIEPLDLRELEILPDDASAPEASPAPPPSESPKGSAPAQLDPIESGRSEISALVERIAQFKRTREAPSTDSERSPRLPLGEEPVPRDNRAVSFGFAADAGGRIEWAEASIAPMVIGTRLVSTPMLGDRREKSALEHAFLQRQPIIQASAELLGSSAITGEWIVDAQPRFTDDGNFTGYVGRFRRPVDLDPDAPSPAAREADRIRQLLHELRTPVTAVQGYAEVIQQQLFGPAPHEYRALAAGIAADAARILAGFEELDRLARLETGVAEMSAGETDIAAIARHTVNQLAHVLSPRMAGIELNVSAQEPLMVPLDPEEAELLIWRLMATLGGGCAAGEVLSAQLSASGIEMRLTLDLPAQLLAEDDLFTAEAKPIGTAINAGLFGAGFALRLARAEARGADGDLLQADERIVLTLPLIEAVGLTDASETNSPLSADAVALP